MIGWAKQIINVCMRTAWSCHGASQKALSSSRNLTRISKHSVNNVAERAEVDEDDDTEDNSSFGVESVLMVAAWP